MEGRKTKGGWPAKVVFRVPNGEILVVHDLPPLEGAVSGYTAVWGVSND